MFGDVPLEPQEAFVHVNGDVSLADETQDQVVGEARVASLHLAEGGPKGLGSRNITVLQLKERDKERKMSLIYFLEK